MTNRFVRQPQLLAQLAALSGVVASLIYVPWLSLPETGFLVGAFLAIGLPAFVGSFKPSTRNWYLGVGSLMAMVGIYYLFFAFLWLLIIPAGIYVYAILLGLRKPTDVV
jgi:hypothetical protein